MGGLNDMLCQIEKACRYAERFDRTVVVDANYYLSRYFRDDLSTYFTSRQSTLILDPAELGERLDEMEVFPGVLAGRVNRYEDRATTPLISINMSTPIADILCRSTSSATTPNG